MSLDLGNRIGLGKVRHGSLLNPFESETIALLSRMTIAPSDEKQTLINSTIRDLKSAGVWEKLDVWDAMDLHDQQSSLLNWIKNENNPTAIGSPVFSANNGYTGASGKYINTNFNPLTQGVNYVASSAVIGVFLNNNIAAGTKAAYAGLNGAGGIILYPLFNSTTAYTRLNSSSWSTHPNTETKGLYIHVKPSPTISVFWKNGVKRQVSDATTVIGDATIYLFRRFDTPGDVYDGQASLFFAGGALTDTQAIALNAIAHKYRGTDLNTSVFFGDSITAGTGASVTANRFTSVFSASESTVEQNIGLSGQRLQSDPTTPTGLSMYENMDDIPPYVSAYKYLFFEYGTNDAGAYPSGQDRFETQYNAVLNHAISAKKWPKSKIKLINIYRRDDNDDVAYNAKLALIASANGVQLIDTASILAADHATYMSDSVHPNDAGHTAMAIRISATIT